MQRSLPGPVGTSCLTCKQRHKKCDQRRPICTTCEAGGFECLGYNHHRSATRAVPPNLLKPRPIMSKSKQKERDWTRSITHRLMAIKEQARLVNGEYSTDKSSPTESGMETAGAIDSPSSQTSASPKIFYGSAMAPYSKYHHTETVTTGNYLSLLGSKIVGNLPPLEQLFINFFSIPRTPSNPITAFLRSPQFEDYVLAHLNRMMSYVYFKPIRDQKARILQMITTRIRSSWITRWIVLIDARICEQLIDDTLQPKLYSRWIRDIEGTVRTTLAHDPTSPETHGLQGDWLALLIMKVLIAPSSNTIEVLRSATPTFLQTAYSCPELWSNNSNLTRIPLLNVASSNNHELASFALVDCTCAMVFGLPQQVEYDTTITPLPNATPPYEWAHSCPMEFLVLLAEINACRDKRPGARDWREIEHQLVTWLPRPAQHGETWESWMAVAWLAVQEIWRLTLLMYLYLAVCGALSDEPRIQLSISQLLQVVGTIRKHDSPEVNIAFFVQYLMVGICANRESHRRIVRDKLSNKFQTKFWRLRATDFVPVLDHLWHGAGSNGHPIKWCDYVHSREALIPVMM
ncbi:Thiamine biosynthesis regulatory protein [Saccharomyces cerevisiae S288c] [Rhizoctonia solani]|uniref:Thiamine biosynthesis regulatory protein [Saccharomyces cerevisiae S288c] n=1 Tax=Rhizoctonia solani TaxID=456999 RepID=A0A0K6G4K5_9AGAM|nr:Thiamine biosynthesis regulatory protein [Saccharomyces cerevisiae S288c] [Rhizoctonia solani]